MLHPKTKIKSKLLILLSISTFISGCSMVPPVDKYNAESFSSGKKGIAILRVSEHNSKFLNETDISLTYNIKKLNDDKVAQKRGHNSFMPGIHNSHDYTSEVMMLDPGLYYIDHLKLNDLRNGRSTIIRSYSGPGVSKLKGNSNNKYIVKIGAFEVKPGKVTYFGHAHLAEKSKLPFEIKNEITAVKADLTKSGLSELSNKVEQGKFIQSGSVIINQGVNYSVIDAAAIQERSMAIMDKVTDDLIANK